MPGAIERGTPGASARREWERRRDGRERRIRSQYGRLGGVILAVTADPQSTTAWAKGAVGEETIGRSLELLAGEGCGVLHDRRIPGSRANIDHIVVSRAGVFVVDPKNYGGRVEQRVVGGLFNSELRLVVGRRDQTKLIAQARRQCDAVRAALASTKWADVPIVPTICFMQPENWPLLAFRPLRFGDVYVLWGKALGKLIRSEPKLATDDVEPLTRALAVALPVA